MAENALKLQKLSLQDKEDKKETMDEGTSTYLMQAKEEQHNILYLNYKQLQFIPKVLVAGDDFRCIKQLYLRNNCLEELPDSISNLGNLQTLYLHSNKLKNLPEGISKCTELQNLDISDNILQEVPSCICRLPKLHTLRINDNRITSISKDIRHLKLLRALYLRSNLISHVPVEITECTSLKMIVLDCNKVSTLPRELTSLNPSSLQLFVHTNNLIHLPFGLAEVVKDLFIDRNPHLHGLALNDISSCKSINKVVHPSFYNQCVEDTENSTSLPNVTHVKTMCSGKMKKIYLPSQIGNCLTEEKPVVPPLLELNLRAVHRSLSANKLSRTDVPDTLRQLSPVAKCGNCRENTSIFTFGYLILYECSGSIQHLDLPFSGLAYSLLCTYHCLKEAQEDLHRRQVTMYRSVA